MNKDKLIKGAVWLSGFSISIMISAVCLFIGFNNLRYGSYLFLIIGLIMLPIIFFCAFKGFKFILDAIFD
tara:strand:- start:391 stop:600 length:210 start_codon:yes stop_codon:yes gene_type:complete